MRLFLEEKEKVWNRENTGIKGLERGRWGIIDEIIRVKWGILGQRYFY